MKNTPVYRYLRGYTIDPAFSTQLDTFGVNETFYRIRWEDNLLPGPIGEYFEVIDYDPASECFYEPVDLNSAEVLAQGGLVPSEGNPQFHQQFVYTIAMRTLEYFERALGRKVIWYRREAAGEDGTKSYEYVERLRIYPHALREANAYYDPSKRALLFGLFRAGSTVNNVNYPGGVVFTCLAPDIVAHETTHAILESIHPHFGENTNSDVPAFHEAFADLIALLQRFMVPEFLVHQLTRSGGKLDEFTLLGELGTQFGYALERGQGALRGAIGQFNPDTKRWEKIKPNPMDYQEKYEAHERGAILVATIFDAFVRLYNHKTRDLFLISEKSAPGPELIGRLAGEAADIARHLLQICIQALDYCPPFDITFGDYLRALITADFDLAPSDEEGYRIALIEAFRVRGIFPDRVNTLSVESLRWTKPVNFNEKEKMILAEIGSFLQTYIRELIDTKKRESIYRISETIQRELHQIIEGDSAEVDLYADCSEKEEMGFLDKLGMASKYFTLEYEGQTYQSGASGSTRKAKYSKNPAVEPPFQVHSVRPAFRYTREGRLEEQVLVTLTQRVDMTANGQPGVQFRGGCTIIFRMADTYEVEYIISKNIQSSRRFANQMNYQSGKTTDRQALHDTMYEGESQDQHLSFKHLHQSII